MQRQNSLTTANLASPIHHEVYSYLFFDVYLIIGGHNYSGVSFAIKWRSSGAGVYQLRRYSFLCVQLHLVCSQRSIFINLKILLGNPFMFYKEYGW